MKRYIAAFDEGTTSARTLIYDIETQRPVSVAARKFTQIYPKPGWVEHDPQEIWDAQIGSFNDALCAKGISPGEIAAIGITNQRETVVAWDKSTGRPLYNAIVWQCRRTAELTERLKLRGFDEYIKKSTGLVPDAYFSATKIRWLIDNVPEVKQALDENRLMVGTIDTWLIYKLTGGREYVTDYSNASRTMLFNIHTLDWDGEILNKLSIPKTLLPKVVSSVGLAGTAQSEAVGAQIPITGIGGDQQCALFGQGCFSPGSAKITYGTGCFILMNTGKKPVYSNNNLLTTIAWGIDGHVEYALEGSIYSAGSIIKWMREEMGIIERSSDVDRIVYEVPDNGGVYMVPAFTGLGAPFWDMYARGTVVGLTRGTGRKHFIRAAIESIGFQSKAVFDAMEEDSGLRLSEIKADGGVSVCDFLLQLQADLSGISVLRPDLTEVTAIGAVYMAGIGAGIWKSTNETRQNWRLDKAFYTGDNHCIRLKEYAAWQRAVQRAASWEE